MGPKLQALLDLQQVELQIVDIKRQLARKERAVTAQQKRLDTLRRELSAEQEAVKRAQVDVDAADLDLKTRQGHIDRMRERLNTVKTNKEYAATLAELNNEKADVSKLEARALELMGAVEGQKEALIVREQSETREIDRLRDLEAQLDQTRQSFADKLKRLETQKQRVVEGIEPEELKLFDRLSERHDGEALAEIERPHPRKDEFLCGGCYMSLSAEIANAVLTRDELVTCRNCGRIVWMEKGT